MNSEELIKLMLLKIGEEPEREGLVDTPKRVVKSWDKLFGGYTQDPNKILGTTFTQENYNEMVVLKNIEFYSTCEHHMIPFFGKVSIGYIPDGQVVGISKLARLVEVFARRLQIQEQMTNQIAETIDRVLKPKGCMVIAEAQHLCMVARGVEKQNSVMITSALRGSFQFEPVRNEFLTLIK